MANTASDLMANILASPAVLNDVSVSRGRTRTERAVLTVAGTESALHIFPIARLPGSAHIMGMRVSNGAMGTTFTVDIGIFPETDWSAGDGTPIDADFYADGADLALASTLLVEVLGTGVVGEAPAAGQAIFLDAGDTKDTAAGAYDIALTIATTGTPLADSIVVMIDYTMGD